MIDFGFVSLTCWIIGIAANVNFYAFNQYNLAVGGDTFYFKNIENDSDANELLNSKNVQFWLKDIRLSSDSFLIVNNKSREVLAIAPKQVIQKIEAGDNLKVYSGIYKYLTDSDSLGSIKFVRGRYEFFQYNYIGPKIHTAATIFEAYGVNPIIAKLLLIIESPNDSKGKSISGAVGHFQLMPSVAKQYGLKVKNNLDEREDFIKSSVAAAKLVKKYCIPWAKKIALKKGLDTALCENKLWFQLLVLHIYNAGAGTVSRAVDQIESVSSGRDLIQQLWTTQYRAFGNSSQNYSQVCLASYLAYKEFLQMKLWQKNVDVRPISSDD